MSGGNKFKNKIDKLTGRARQLAGDALGDRRMSGRGRREQIQADLRDAGEKVKDAVRSGRGRRGRRSRTQTQW
ncbi:CsbD family protein [Nocardia sp. NPDC052001]|uniref:CsbD family protein n=1 Tax=unclassified Nocardia TaxID=2637762 RepID=UPI00342437A6